MIRQLYKLASVFKKLAYGMISSFEEAARILGISVGATDAEIKQAFKRKAIELHPDKNKDRDTTHDMKLVIAARDLLLSKNPKDLHPGNSQQNQTEQEENPQDLWSRWQSYVDENDEESWESIANRRREEGRESFDRHNSELMEDARQSLGLDGFNKIFEGYDPNYNGPEGPEAWAEEDARDEYIYRVIEDEISLYDLCDAIYEDPKKYKHSVLILLQDYNIEHLLRVAGSDSLKKINDRLSKRGITQNEIDKAIRKFADNFINKLINNDNFSKIMSPEEIIFGENYFSYVIYYIAFAVLEKNKILELVEKLRNHPNKFKVEEDRWGFKRKSIDFSVLFPKDDKEVSNQCGNAFKNFLVEMARGEGKDSRYYLKYIEEGTTQE